jgi:hypothetical protein
MVFRTEGIPQGGGVSKPLIPYGDLKGARDVRREVKLRDPMKKVNKERVAAKKTAEGFDPDYLAWIRKQPCIICGLVTGQPLHYSDKSERLIGAAFIEAAHMAAGRTKGTDMTALPVEQFFHRTGSTAQHRIGIKSWAKLYRLDIPALIAAHRKRYSLEMAERAAKQAKA